MTLARHLFDTLFDTCACSAATGADTVDQRLVFVGREEGTCTFETSTETSTENDTEVART